MECMAEKTPFAHGYGSNFILSALSSASSLESIIEDPRKELRDYLESPRDIYATNPIKWWGVSNLSRFLSILSNHV